MFSLIDVIACVVHARIRTSVAKKAWATVGGIVMSAVIAVPTALGCVVPAKIKTNAANAVRAIADAIERNAADSTIGWNSEKGASIR